MGKEKEKEKEKETEQEKEKEKEKEKEERHHSLPNQHLSDRESGGDATSRNRKKRKE